MAVPLIGIVDDYEPLLDAISGLVRSAGYQSATFPSAESLLASHRIHEIDCLIVDYHLTGLDGLGLRRLLAESNHSTPLILISVQAEMVRERALKEGFAAVLRKPFEADALLDAVESVLRR